MKKLLMMLFVVLSASVFVTVAYAQDDSAAASGDSDAELEQLTPQPIHPVHHDYEIFLGASLGATSQSDANSIDRALNFSYGLEGIFVYHHFAFGPSIKIFGIQPDGSAVISVGQQNYWGSLEGRYRFWDAEFSPYVSLGGGGVFQNVSTLVMGNSSNTSAFYLSRDVGFGLTGKINDSIGVNVAARYFQFSTLNGFDYTLSFGFYL